MVPTLRITKAGVDSVAAAAATVIHWDDRLKGFGLKIEPSGKKSYLVQYRMGGRGSSTRRYTIGPHGSPWTPTTARDEAERLLHMINTGTDPMNAAKERQRLDQDLAFASYALKFLDEYGRRLWRPRTWASAESNLRRFAIPILGKKPIPTIRRADIIAVFDKLPPDSPALPRNLFALLRKLFAWACERDDIERSPFQGFKSPPSVQSRERVLSDRELVAILSATSDLGEPFGTFVRLLLATGQRRDEVASMRWEELDRSAALWTIPGQRTKNGHTHELSLAPLVLAELDRVSASKCWPNAGFVFSTNGRTSISGFSRMKRRLDARVSQAEGDGAVAPWRLHDLRRTMATGLQRLGVRFEVTEAILNHVGGARSGIAGVYQRHDWKAEKQQALESWTAHVGQLQVAAHKPLENGR